MVSAPPGAGKSTLVPLHLLNDGRVSGRIVVLEPRRVAARAVAQRMAELSGTALGELVGYRTRDDAVITENTRIEVVTEGILTRRLQNDPDLSGTSILIFDEVHERNLTTDIGLAFSIDVASTLRPDLAICTMSATADTDRMSRLLDGAPVLTCDGRKFEVDIRWRPLNNNRRSTRPPTTTDLISAITDVTTRALDSDDGDVLVFLPGIGEINRLRDALSSVIDDDISIHRLAGSVPREEQDAALRRAHQRRSIILATDIAETSLTVDGVNIVVDSGLVRVPRFDSRTGMTRLMTMRPAARQQSNVPDVPVEPAPECATACGAKLNTRAGSRFLNPRSIRSSSVDSHSNLRNGEETPLLFAFPPSPPQPRCEPLRAPYHPGSRH